MSGDTDSDSARLQPDEVVSATYYPNKVRVVRAALSGSIAGLAVGIAFVLVTGDDATAIIATAAFIAVGSILSVYGSVSNTRLRFGTDWVEGPREGGVGSVLMRRKDIAGMDVVDEHKLRVLRHDEERLMVNLDHYEFMEQQMIRMRLTSLAGGRTTTPPETLVQESRGHRLGVRRKED